MDLSPDTRPMRDNGCSSALEIPHSFLNLQECKRYTLLEVIGKGSYGVVFAAVDNLTKEKVAIKWIQNVFDNDADATRILREIKLLRSIKHPDVVELKHILLPSDPCRFKDLYLVFELLESDLHTVIRANDDLSPDHHKVFAYQMLRGIEFIHGCGVYHRDLKPKNVLANSNCKLKICDFGLARPSFQAAQSSVMWTDYVATRWYRAPELCGCFYGSYTSKVDIWSIGCIFAEVLLGAPLLPGSGTVNQLELITDLLGKPSQAVIDSIPNPKAKKFLNELPFKHPGLLQAKFPNADPLAIDLLTRLLAFNPVQRISATEALKHPYFAGLPVTEPTNCLIPKAEFEFESRKTPVNVRQLIFQEVLHYHHAVRAAAIQSLSAFTPFVWPSSFTMQGYVSQNDNLIQMHHMQPQQTWSGKSSITQELCSWPYDNGILEHQFENPHVSAMISCGTSFPLCHNQVLAA